MFSTYFDVSDWVQAITPQLNAQAWQHSRQQATPWAQWNAYLNQLCLEGVLENLNADKLNGETPSGSNRRPQEVSVASSPQAIGMNHQARDRTWSLVNGSVITVGSTRIALIPSEAVDQSELEVPQEWLDIPRWAADYYLAVFVMPDAETLHIAGYATHQQIKQQGYFNPQARSYHLPIEGLTTDLNLLWLTRDRYTTAQTRGSIAAPANLSATQAQNLIQRLGSPQELMPRLEVPFSQWAALLDQPEWHEQLYRQRQGTTASLANRLTNQLSNWLQGQFDPTWQTITAVLAPQQMAIATRSNATIEPRISRAKVITVGNGQVGLVVNLSPINETEIRIELQIHPTGNSIHLPGETELRLLSMTGLAIAQAKATVTETIRLQFRANYGEAFQLAIICNDQTVVETFEL
jgi:hypothetical protein